MRVPLPGYAKSHDLGYSVFGDHAKQTSTPPASVTTTVVVGGPSYDEVWNRCFIALESQLSDTGNGLTARELGDHCRAQAAEITIPSTSPIAHPVRQWTVA